MESVTDQPIPETMEELHAELSMAHDMLENSRVMSDTYKQMWEDATRDTEIYKTKLEHARAISATYENMCTVSVDKLKGAFAMVETYKNMLKETEKTNISEIYTKMLKETDKTNISEVYKKILEEAKL